MILILSYILFFTGSISSQDIPSTSTGELKFYVDYSSFKGDKNKTYQEFYLMIHADQLGFTGVENKNAFFKVNSTIKDEGKKIIAYSEWITDALLNRDSINLKNLVVYDQWAELLNPGNYFVSVVVTEQDKKISGKADFNIYIPSFIENEFAASDFEFISRIEEDIENNHFSKNGRIIVPNPWRRYGLLNPKLSFYYEIYNIKKPDSNQALSVDYLILDKNNNEIKILSDIRIKKSGNDISVVHGIDLADLNSGIYTLVANISDPKFNLNYSVSRPFEIIQIDYLTQNPSLTEEEAETGGKLIEYLATPQENKLFNSLSLQGKTHFLVNFWKERDTSPGTIENEYLQSVMQRFNYANQHFSWGNIEGHKTDKGRVIIRYGIPDEINSRSSESGMAPYEIWRYTRDREFIFVFGDKNSTGNFILLHSTKEGEIYDSNWKEYLRSL